MLDITAEAWIYFTIDPTSRLISAIMGKSDGSAPDQSWIMVARSTGAIEVTTSTDGTSTDVASRTPSKAFASGEWRHVAFTRDGTSGDVIIYIDGVKQGATEAGSDTGTLHTPTGVDFRIAQRGNETSRWFQGHIAQVRVWNVVRTADEIADNFRRHLAPDTAGLVASFPLDGDTDDKTSNANNLTEVNTFGHTTLVPFGSPTHSLALPTTEVPLEASAAPTTGQVLTKTATGADTVSGSAAPTAGQALLADSATDASWQELPAASAFATTGSDVTVSGSAAPSTNDVLIAGSSTTATWQKPGDLVLARVSGSTYSTLQHLQDIFHSSGWSSGGEVVDDGDGTVTVSGGTGLIRPVNSSVGEIRYFDWALENGANVALADNSINYIYAEYNGGSPQVVARTVESEDFQTDVLLSTIYRIGTTLHISSSNKHEVGDHASNMLRRMKDVMPFARISGGAISETGTLNFAVTVGNWWHGLTRFTTPAIDTSTGGTFSYYYQDGVGGFTEIAAQTDIDNLQYDDDSGTLATLSNNRYAVAWVYVEQDSVYSVVYGRGDYTLVQAEDAQIPSSVPPHLQEAHGKLLGKIIVQKSASSFTSIESVFTSSFETASPTDHNSLLNLASGDVHTQYVNIDGSRAMTGGLVVVSGTQTGIGIPSPQDTLHVGGGQIFELEPSNNFTIDGRTFPRLITLGAVRQNHTAGIAGTRAYHIDVESAGFDDTRGLVVRHDLSGSSSTINPKNLSLNADITGATNTRLDFLHVSKVGSLGAGMDLHALNVYEDIDPVNHLCSTPISVEKAWTYDDSLASYADVTTEFGDAGTDVQMFVENSDVVYIGKDMTFTAVAVELAVFASNPGIKPTFEYSQGGSSWGLIAVGDNTNGFRQNGTLILTLPGDWATDTVNGTSKYWFRITRTANTLATTPTEDTIKYYTPTTYSWDKDGIVTVGRAITNAGTVTDPAYGFATDSDTGLYWSGTDTFAVSTSGIQAVRWNEIQQTLAPDGTQALPTYSFASNAGMGMSVVSSNNLSFTTVTNHNFYVGASVRAQVGNQGLSLGSNGSAASPSIFRSTDTDTGVYWDADNSFMVTTSGVQAASWDYQQNQKNAGSIYLSERASPAGDESGYIQLWAKNDNTLWFTTDTGTDVELGVGGGSHPDPHLLADGSAGAATYSFTSNSGTGLYSPSTFEAAITTSGVQAVSWDWQQNQVNAGTIQAAWGTTSGPGYSFTGAGSTTGMYGNGATDLRFSVGGTMRQLLHTTFVRYAFGGTAADPAIQLSNNNTGVYRPSEGQIGLATAGSVAATWDSSANQTSYGKLLPDSTFVRDIGEAGNFWLNAYVGEYHATSTTSDTIPRYTFGGDTDTGMGRSAGDTVDIITNGTMATKWNSTQQQISASGTEALPTYSFVGDEDSGWWSPAGNTMGLSLGGTDRFNFTSTQIRVAAASSLSNPYICASSDTNTGPYHPADNQWGISINAGSAVIWNSNRQTQVQAGTESLPAYVFTGANTTGFWSPGSNTVALSTGANEAVRWDGTKDQTNLGSIDTHVNVTASGTVTASGISATEPFQLIEVVSATSSSSAFGNGVSYIPLREGQSDSISFQFVAESSAPTELAMFYAMSAANSGDVSLRMDILINSNGSDPSATATSGTEFYFTPGNDVLQHNVDSSDSSDFRLWLNRGDFVYGSIERPNDGSDTHTGDCRVLQILLRDPE
jgi:hypothetical protein